jgi:hypothetical protein
VDPLSGLVMAIYLKVNIFGGFCTFGNGSKGDDHPTPLRKSGTAKPSSQDQSP